MQLYLVDGDFSLAEFVESIDENGPLGPNDRVADAIAERFSVWMGSTTIVTSGATGPNDVQFKNKQGGGLLTENPRWTFARTKSWNWAVINLGGAFTTGASVRIRVKNFGVWVT